MRAWATIFLWLGDVMHRGNSFQEAEGDAKSGAYTPTPARRVAAEGGAAEGAAPAAASAGPAEAVRVSEPRGDARR